MIKLCEKNHHEVMMVLNREPNFNLLMITFINQYRYNNDYQQVYGEFSNDILDTVILKRGTKIYYYTMNQFQDSQKIVNHLKLFDFKYINGKENSIVKMYNYLYDYHYRSLFYAKLSSFEKKNVKKTKIIEISSFEELDKYYKLLYSINELDLIKVANKEQYIRMIKSNIDNHIKRIFVIEDDGEYISTANVTAENEFGAMIKGVATRKEYRNQGLVTSILNHICDEYINVLNKNLYLFYESQEIGKIYTNLGFKVIDKWCMLVKK